MLAINVAKTDAVNANVTFDMKSILLSRSTILSTNCWNVPSSFATLSLRLLISLLRISISCLVATSLKTALIIARSYIRFYNKQLS